MSKLQIILTIEVVDKATAQVKLQQLKAKLVDTGMKLSASYSDIIQPVQVL